MKSPEEQLPYVTLPTSFVKSLLTVLFKASDILVHKDKGPCAHIEASDCPSCASFELILKKAIVAVDEKIVDEVIQNMVRDK